MPFWIKLPATVALILGISEIGKKSGQVAALVTALPWIALLSLVWLHLDGQSAEKIADYSTYTFWYVVPTLPMFLILPRLLAMGWNFWAALGLGALSAVLCLAALAPLALRFGIKLF